MCAKKFERAISDPLQSYVSYTQNICTICVCVSFIHSERATGESEYNEKKNISTVAMNTCTQTLTAPQTHTLTPLCRIMYTPKKKYRPSLYTNNNEPKRAELGRCAFHIVYMNDNKKNNNNKRLFEWTEKEFYLWSTGCPLRAMYLERIMSRNERKKVIECDPVTIIDNFLFSFLFIFHAFNILLIADFICQWSLSNSFAPFKTTQINHTLTPFETTLRHYYNLLWILQSL